MRSHHIADHLWLVEYQGGGAAFESRDDEGVLISCDSTLFDSTASACLAYRSGYVPNVTYP